MRGKRIVNLSLFQAHKLYSKGDPLKNKRSKAIISLKPINER